MLSSPPPSSKDVFFFSPSLPDFLGGVHCPLCPKALSLYLSLSYSLFLSFTGHKERGRGRGEVFHLDKEGHGEDSATKEQRNREGGRKRKEGDNETEKGDASVYLCSHVLCSFPLAAV